MSYMKNALLDLELAAATMNYRREELAEFIADNAYTRGGAYPKKIRAIKKALAESMIKVHMILRQLESTHMPPRDVKISRRTTVRWTDNGFIV